MRRGSTIALATSAVAFFALALSQCKLKATEADARASDEDGKPCAMDSECRSGGVCLHGICLGPACACNVETSGQIIPGLGGTKKIVCRGDCAASWECGVPAPKFAAGDAGAQNVSRCLPTCNAANTQDASSECPPGLQCGPVTAGANTKNVATCALAPPTAAIDGPGGVVPEETRFTVTARDTSAHGRIAEYQWVASPYDGAKDASVSNRATFELEAPEGAAEVQATALLTSELGVTGRATYKQAVCRKPGGQCSGTMQGYLPCCPGQTCERNDAGFEFCRAP